MKVVIVTGANQGIGFAMTQQLLADGYRVAVFDIEDDQLKALADEYPDSLRVYVCDVTDCEQVNASVADVAGQWGGIDVLVNNAVLAVFEPFETRPLEKTRREFEVNYFGALNTIYAVLPYMKKQQGGIIHNVSSGVGITGFPGIYGYASTKGALESLTRTLALEFKTYSITVNLMHPPLTNTRSASPLGVPVQIMDDPEKVGSKLAKQILSTRGVIVPDFRSRVYIFLAYRFPRLLGGFFASMTEKALQEQAQQESNSSDYVL